MTKKNRSVGILGGGISGLSSAYALSKKGINVTVYEKTSTVGGAIQTFSKDGWLIEEGPNTLMVKSKIIWELLDDLNLTSKSVTAGKTAKKRYIVKNNEPTPLPMSPVSFLTTDLFSTKSKLRLLKEPFAKASTKNDESVADFINRRLGTEPLNYAVNPFISGIYAGDPKKLSIKHTFPSLWNMEQQHGSLLKGIFKHDRSTNSTERALISFEKGNQQLPQAIADTLDGEVHLQTEIKSVFRKQDKWIVEGHKGDAPFTASHDVIISTLPAFTLSKIFKDPAFQTLDELPYAPLSVVALGFSDEQIGHPLDGFGMLIPEVEQYKTLGALFSSSLFPNRTPKKHQLLTCFIGGARNPELAEKPAKKLQSIVLNELGKLLNIIGEPVFTHHRFWPRTIPQYEVGYDRFLNQIKQIETRHKGLFIQGNFRDGVSVSDCILSGFETADKISSF